MQKCDKILILQIQKKKIQEAHYIFIFNFVMDGLQHAFSSATNTNHLIKNKTLSK